MNQKNTQELSPDQVSAHLAFATHLNEQMLPQDDPQQIQERASQSNSQPESQPQQDNTAEIESIIDNKMEILRNEMKDTIKMEIDNVRKDIKDAINGQE